MGQSEADGTTYGTGKCTICGEKATGYWHGEGLVEVCHHCAIDVLPKLIADAIHVPRVDHRPGPWPVEAGRNALSRVKAAFWEAMSSRLAGELRRAKQHPHA